MARATTEVFAEMVVELETTGGALPVAVTVTNLTNVASAVATVAAGDITKFALNDIITIQGIPAPNAAKNGTYKVGTITSNSFPLLAAGSGTALDLSGLAAPLTQVNAPGLALIPTLSNTLVWSKICGITSRTVSRTTTMQQTEIPDCTDETLPNSIEKSVQAQEETISGTGVWAAQSNGIMMDWWRSGARKSVRVGNLKALTGTILYEYGPAFLTQLNNTAEKGPKVTSDIQIEFDGLPQVTYA